MSAFEDVAIAVRNYINLHVNNIEDIEIVTFNLSFHRTNKDEFTVGWPVIQETRFEDLTKGCNSSEYVLDAERYITGISNEPYPENKQPESE